MEHAVPLHAIVRGKRRDTNLPQEVNGFGKVLTIFCGLQMILQFEESISAVTQILQFEEAPSQKGVLVLNIDR